MPAPKGNKFALGNNGGRPSTYPADVGEKKKLFERIIAYASEGKSITQISARIDVPKTTLLRWADDHDEFRTILTRAKELEMSWWEDQATDNLKCKEFNANLWNKSVASRFKADYGDKIVNEHVGKDGEALAIGASSQDIAHAVMEVLREAKLEAGRSGES